MWRKPGIVSLIVPAWGAGRRDERDERDEGDGTETDEGAAPPQSCGAEAAVKSQTWI